MDSIKVDVDRTCGELSYFSDGLDDGTETEIDSASGQVKLHGDGRAVLQRMLLAYSRSVPEVGYVQGMSYVAAFVLLVFVGKADHNTVTPLDLEVSAKRHANAMPGRVGLPSFKEVCFKRSNNW